MIRRFIRRIFRPQPALSDPGWAAWFVGEAMREITRESGRRTRRHRLNRRR